MDRRIEDYALLADGRCAALLGRDGSIDWLCWPRFDNDPCFAALLGDAANGHWQIAPAEPVLRVTRRYEADTLVMRTDFECGDGCLRLTDFMAAGTPEPCLVRIVECVSGRVSLRMRLAARRDADAAPPTCAAVPGGATLESAGVTMRFLSELPLTQEDDALTAWCAVRAGKRMVFALCHGAAPSLDLGAASLALHDTLRHWRRWIAPFDDNRTHWPQAVRRSLLTLKALIYRPSGALIAAPTTSLPEAPGQDKNWDYRYCWLRDASFALEALIEAGFHDEALAWRGWLLRTLGPAPGRLHVMYCVDGTTVQCERNLDALPGWRGARPVRIGNAAARQYQLDVYGEALDCLYLARKAGLETTADEAALEAHLIRWLIDHHGERGSGIWESRGDPRHFTLSRVMAWVALDRFIAHWCEAGPGEGDALVQRAMTLRRAIHEEVCEHGWHPQRQAFVRSYGETALDASVLLLPLVGFMRADDPRMSATIDAIRAELDDDGLIRRWAREEQTGGTHGAAADGAAPSHAKAPDEGAFLACSCWMADCLYMRGDEDAARRQLERVLAVANDVGLLSEEYDTREQRLVGNFPQVLTHLAIVKTALLLSGTAHGHRSARGAGATSEGADAADAADASGKERFMR